MNSDLNELRKQLPPFRSILTTSIILTAIGLAGLVIVIFFTLPMLGPRWLLFFLVTLLFSGLALPVVYYFNLRFPSRPVASNTVLVREALWLGVYFDLILWLQFGKVLNFALAVFIFFGLAAIELLIRVAERNRFNAQR
ncbi:MAG: hypothetical protein KBF64_06035 [Anaerolineaceae bacterium]|nr:hypothetical protein [Anaerolineaceae bacterium]